MAHRFSITATGPGFSSFTFGPAQLPLAEFAQAYSEPLSPYVDGGAPPYGPYAEVSQAGPDTISVASDGTVTMTPVVPNARVTNTGAFRTTNVGKVRIIT